LDEKAHSYVLAIMSVLIACFCAFIIFTSNPFLLSIPEFPVDGRDLNPLLQDIGLILHPPLLYLGYVGFSVSFAFTIAALLCRDFSPVWIMAIKTWALVAWGLLTLGIVLGSWWAYNELGWGGWWFWDPVENASLMPWLAGGALIHALSAALKKQTLIHWCVLLAILTFALSLLGTFLVRSGILISVHAFTSDPSRGWFILVILSCVVGSALWFYARSASSLPLSRTFPLQSRESLIFIAVTLLVVALSVVFIGTLFPILYKQLGLGSLSVGAPFFNELFFYLGCLLCVAIVFSPSINWSPAQTKLRLPVIGITLAVSTVITVLVTRQQSVTSYPAFIGLLLGIWVFLSHAIQLVTAIKSRGWCSCRSMLPMMIAHIGVAVMVLGITMVSAFSHERDIRIRVGETYQVEDTSVHFSQIRQIKGANFVAQQGVFDVILADHGKVRVTSEKRFYPVAQMPLSEAGIHRTFLGDIYIALAEPLSEDMQEWAVRIYLKPMISWIWAGGVMIALAAFFSAIRLRRTKHA
jgi:cytochrome c-type biogenesis protein CcmF